MALKNRISLKYLREKIGDESIFYFYFGKPVDIYKSYYSFFRKEKHSSSGFYISKGGYIIYHDFKTGEKLNCVQFVMKLFRISYSEAILQIAIDFNIVKGVKSSDKEAVVIPIEKQQREKPVKNYKITVKSLGVEHLKYWEQYHITEQELKDAGVKAVTSISVNDYKLPIDSSIRFLYRFEEQETHQLYFKVYSPLDDNYKWMGSVPIDCLFGIEHLRFKSDTLIITKSVKDYLVLRKYFSDVIALQNESSVSLNKKTIKALKKCYKRIVIWFDTDRTGVVSMNYYKKKHGFIPFFICDKNISIWKNFIKIKKNHIKDPSDFVKKYGLEKFEKYIIELNHE